VPGGTVKFLLCTGKIVDSRAEAGRELKSVGLPLSGNTQLVLIRESRIVEVIGSDRPDWVEDWIAETNGIDRDDPMTLVRDILAGRSPRITEAMRENRDYSRSVQIDDDTEWSDTGEIQVPRPTPKKLDPVALARELIRKSRK